MSCCCCCPATLAIGAVVLYLIYKFFFKNERKEPELQVQSWEKDTVYLFQFPRTQHLPNLSPFCLKLESFLRVNKIKHEIRESSKLRSKYGLLPFIELNGKHYADSQLIDLVLRDHFKINQFASKHDEGVARAVDRMIDSFTFGLLMRFKVLDNPSEFGNILLSVLELPTALSAIASLLVPYYFKSKVTKRVNAIVGPFSRDEHLMLFRKDMTAIQEILGDKNYLFGDKITSTDCTVFSQIATVYYLPYQIVLQKVIREEFKPIHDYLERFRHELHIANYEHDKVYLFQYPRTNFIPNLSPFCLKVESLLRVHNIKHEIQETTKLRSKYGLLPFIELNGKQYADSQLIDFVLRDHFQLDKLQYSSKYEEGVARAVDRLVDSFTFGMLINFKVMDDPSQFSKMLLGMMKLPAPLSAVAGCIVPCVMKSKVKKRVDASVGPFSRDEYLMLFRKDMAALVNILGDKKFLFGDRPTSADCTVFGQIATVYYLPYEVVVQKIIREEFKPIHDYLERFKKEVYPNDFTK
ncbi:hypothetical protein WR25_14211 [Diploscapter pachys]|uniref:GST C-terminal domain-containing protein n=1 Tax=Diploscapter pachys TaxID=2018661 RepID=A0A2A2LMX7_9BILA|nr:hypothetical protein WR25_14211 [Diploscapter pachys]